ncbi:MAG: hypothetical protein PHU49_12420 [Syntrophorhabdaceae bacterium]|jgi:hypothetical protein|nr:hypothetical protein [Syntrophorhabdaceae bacterium]MDD5244813.1 hypothetical protein [Syntrophorhabdaceae bacterium]
MKKTPEKTPDIGVRNVKAESLLTGWTCIRNQTKYDTKATIVW